MNDFSELESDLKRLRPAGVSSELTTRIEHELEEAPGESFAVIDGDAREETQSKPRHWSWLPLGLGLAAAATFLVLARPGVDRQTGGSAPTVATAPRATEAPLQDAQPARAFVPSGMTQVVYNTRDEGLHFTPGQNMPVRRVRSHKSETLQWQNRQTGASLQVTYPTEEVTLIPVSGQ